MEVSINGGTPIAGCFFLEHPTKMDDLGVTPFQETSTYFKVTSPADGGHVIFFFMRCGHDFFSHKLRLIIDPKQSSKFAQLSTEVSGCLFLGQLVEVSRFPAAGGSNVPIQPPPGHPKSDARRDAGHVGTGSNDVSD